MEVPARVAIFPASIFVTIPPRESSDPALPAMASICGVICSTVSMKSAVELSSGGAVYRPSMSDSSTNRSAPNMVATRAARRSLSPYRISDVATVSFSLMTGTVPKASRAFDCITSVQIGNGVPPVLRYHSMSAIFALAPGFCFDRAADQARPSSI